MKNVNNETVGHPTHFDDKCEPGHGESRSAQRGVILLSAQQGVSVWFRRPERNLAGYMADPTLSPRYWESVSCSKHWNAISLVTRLINTPSAPLDISD